MQIRTQWFSHGSKISGCASILGSWQICHNVCTSLIVVLAGLGITVQGMPLLFLNRWQLPLWIAAVGLFGVLLLIRVGARMRCITTRGMAGNVGLLLAGLPFSGAWVSGVRTTGLMVVMLVLLWWLKDLIVKRAETGWMVDFVAQGRKVAGGVVGVIAIVGLLVMQTSAAFRDQVTATSSNLVASATQSRMKFTLFDIAQAKSLMDKNGDGKCDSCGMPIDQCIESGMMQCAMDTDAKIGLLQSAHIHATFHLYKDGKELDLTSYGYRMGENDDGKSSSFIHVEDPDFNKLHMHATGVPLKFWFASVGIQFDSATTKVVVNGILNAQGLDYVFKDNDKIMVTLG